MPREMGETPEPLPPIYQGDINVVDSDSEPMEDAPEAPQQQAPPPALAHFQQHHYQSSTSAVVATSSRYYGRRYSS